MNNRINTLLLMVLVILIGLGLVAIRDIKTKVHLLTAYQILGDERVLEVVQQHIQRERAKAGYVDLTLDTEVIPVHATLAQ